MMGNFMNGHLPQSSWLVAIAFILLIGPFALDFHMHYPDEMYYTDAAVRMTQNGDYLTTFLGDGELRFKKPILTYWAVLAGFELFGISAFSSRLFFLLSGALTVILVYKIAMVTFGDRKAAVLASLITASHPVVIFSSTRSIPDILLALFITLSALGFAGLLRHGDSSPKKYLWLLYVGLGMAFQVKGLPAVAIGGIGLLYLLINPWKRISIGKLLYLPAIIVGLIIAVFWFVSMYVKYGATYLDSFYGDQVGVRVSIEVNNVISNLVFATLLMVGMFFPWVLFGFKNFKNNVRLMFNENRGFFGWILVWVISIILMSAMVTKFYERYLLPVVPLTAVGLTWLLSKTPALSKSKGITISLYIFGMLNILLLLFALLLNIGLGASWYIYLGIVFGFMVVIYLLMSRRRKSSNLSWLAISIMLLFFNGSLITYQLSLPHQGIQIADFITSKAIPKGSRIAFVGNLHHASKIRIGLGKDYFVTNLSRENYRELLDHYDYLICEEDIKIQLEEASFKAETASLNWDPKLIPELVQGILTDNALDLLEQKGKKYYWVEDRDKAKDH
jgi:4-amino-4-deoxy-L-arabinose transferase-like glycosyltransferase